MIRENEWWLSGEEVTEEAKGFEHQSFEDCCLSNLRRDFEKRREYSARNRSSSSSNKLLLNDVNEPSPFNWTTGEIEKVQQAVQCSTSRAEGRRERKEIFVFSF